MSKRLTHVGLVVAFFGSMVVVLMLQESAISTATLHLIEAPGSLVENEAPRITCTDNDDCPPPTMYCDSDGVCAQLTNPVCTCSQPQVLRCAESSGRARYVYCANECSSTAQGANCS